MKRLLGKKLKVVREHESLDQAEFADLTGVSLGAIKQYESGTRGVGTETLLKVTVHPQFKKYTLWLMTGDTITATEQIIPRSGSGAKYGNQ